MGLEAPQICSFLVLGK